MNDLPSILLAISLFSNRVAEGVKAGIKARWPDADPATISGAALLTSLVAGVLAALVLNVNVLALFPNSPYLARVPEWAGVVLTGAIASAGSEGLQWLFDLAKAKRDNMVGDVITAELSAASAPPTVKPPSTPET